MNLDPTRLDHLRSLSLAAATLALTLALAGNARTNCAPIPVDPVCAQAGEYVHPWDPSEPTCCAGLEAVTPMELDDAGLCQALIGGAVCVACGDGACGPGENECVCPEDCATDCVPLGGYVWPWDPNADVCCAGLVATVIGEYDAATGLCAVMDGALQCLPCGDGRCEESENPCSCPEDCTNADCIPAGGYVFPWDPSYGVCCPGLQAASVYQIDAAGVCQPLVGGAICIGCGDGACGAGEDRCNCPTDCR